MKPSGIAVDPEIMSGAPGLVGTRVPVPTLSASSMEDTRRLTFRMVFRRSRPGRRISADEEQRDEVIKSLTLLRHQPFLSGDYRRADDTVAPTRSF